MNKDEILEGNKLIAVFDGKKIQGNWVVLGDEYSGRYHIALLKYHSDWNELMRIVEKIKELGWQFHLNSYSVSNDARFINVKTGSTIQNIAWSTQLLATYNVIIDFIKWYNLKQQS